MPLDKRRKEICCNGHPRTPASVIHSNGNCRICVSEKRKASRLADKNNYVYALFKHDTTLPFYVGHGRGTRIYCSKSYRRADYAVVVHDGMTIYEAKRLEAELILDIGRTCTHDGPLVNRKVGDLWPPDMKITRSLMYAGNNNPNSRTARKTRRI